MQLRSIPSILCSFALLMCLCFSCSNLGYEIHITNADIDKRLATKFPLTKTYLLFFNVILSNPRVILHDNNNRITLGIDVEVINKLNKRPKLLRGTVATTSSIQFNNKKGELYLRDFVIDTLLVDGLAEKDRLIIEGLIEAALREYLAHMPIYTLRARDFKRGLMKYVIKDVQIRNGALIVTLGS